MANDSTTEYAMICSVGVIEREMPSATSSRSTMEFPRSPVSTPPSQLP